MTDERSEPASPASLLSAAVGAAAARGLIDPGDHVLVGVSGGPDSVALLHALTRLRRDLGLRLTVGHVHHGLRGEADQDAAFVEGLAARLDCPAHVLRVEVPRGTGRSPEEAARVVRHAALGRLARAIGAHRIALAHTADDQAETVLMRILEGAGPRGLAGIPVRRGRLVRPLLNVDRAAIRAYLVAHRLEAVEDRTNRDTQFLRNRIRHEVLPRLVAEAGAHLPAALRRVARASRETVEALDALVRPRLVGHLTPTPVGWRLALAALAGLPAGAVKATVRLALVEIIAARRLTGLRAAHLDLLAGLAGARTGARVRLPAGIVVERGRDALWVLQSEAVAGPAALPVPGTAAVGDLVQVRAALMALDAGGTDDSASGVRFDAEALGLAPRPGGVLHAALEVRRRGPGDRMVPFGWHDPVRVTTLLAGAGVPRYARARWPVVTCGGEILWLPGIRRAAAAPVTPATRATLRLQAVPVSPPGLTDGDAV
jgi:tRNA(Ile)-lysidine synthase